MQLVFSNFVNNLNILLEKKYLKNSQILDFFDHGGNVLFIGDIDTSRAFRIFGNKMGINMEPIVN